MARTVEFLVPAERREKPSGQIVLAMKRAARHAGCTVIETRQYRGDSDWLVLHGVGSPEGSKARWRHVKSGRHVVIFDLGYFGRKKQGGFYRVSIDTDHPQARIDETPDVPWRFDVHGISLREDHDPAGHVVLVGLGMKSRRYLGLPHWERDQLQALRERFSGRRIVYRPKPGHQHMNLACDKDERPIEQVLRGAALVVCRHSNVAVDAIIAGVPFEAVDGAALALREFTPEARLQFLRRLAWWQWSATEAQQAWRFLSERLQ